MKVQKMVSLTPETAKIAEKMTNFSMWVRIGLRMYSHGTSLAEEARLRIRWAHAAQHLAATLQEYATQIDPEFEQTVEDLIAKAMNQTSLEEYE
tara:strand:+ start:331 stop:612 length:282 start_codon:yes stop_codon:yes gene_type:complete